MESGIPLAITLTDTPPQDIAAIAGLVRLMYLVPDKIYIVLVKRLHPWLTLIRLAAQIQYHIISYHII